MNRKDDLLIRANRNNKRKPHKRRNIAIATTLSVMCIAAMAGVYSMEKQKNTKEELLVNWEDNASSDTEEKVKLNIGSKETPDPSSTLNAGRAMYDTAQNVTVETDTSLLEADLADVQNETIPEQNENVVEPEEDVVGQDAVEVSDETTEVSANNSAVALQFAANDVLNWPVQGNIILDYSMDATTYFPTLDQYKYNPAVLIQSDVGTEVCAAASGVVESIVETEETGITVTMDIGGGYQLVYGQLQGVDFGTGAYIEKGSVVGTVASPTKYYSVEGSNLYFKMLENGAPTDPVNFLKDGVINE